MSIAFSTVQNWKIIFFQVRKEERICMLTFKEYRNSDINNRQCR